MGGDTAHRISRHNWLQVKRVNTAEGWKAARRNNAGWINWAQNKEWGQGEYIPTDTELLPKVEGITSIYSVHRVIETRHGKANLEAYDPTKPIPEWHTPQTHPHLWTKFRSIDDDGNVGLAPGGHEFWFPIFSKDGGFWVPLYKLEYIDELPQEEPEEELTLAVNQGWAQGPDISKWDPAFDPKQSQHRIDFAIIKAGEGTVIDPLFEQHRIECASLPVVGAYTYYRSFIPWEPQAEFAVAIAEESDIDFIAIDYEPINNDLDDTSDNAIREMLSYIRARTDKVVLIYTGLGTYNEIIDRGGEWIRTEPMWIARWYSENWFYNYAEGPNEYIEKYGWEPVNHWVIWQWGGDYHDPSGWSVPGYKEAHEWGIFDKDSVDLNYYPGTINQMMSDFNVAVKEAPLPSTLPYEIAERPGWVAYRDRLTELAKTYE